MDAEIAETGADMTENHDPTTGRFTEGNRPANTKHGGAGAVRALQVGEPFKGLAAQEERQVIEDLEAQGRSDLVLENAVRLQTATRLYWSAVQAAADAGDLKKLDSYCCNAIHFSSYTGNNRREGRLTYSPMML